MIILDGGAHPDVIRDVPSATSKEITMAAVETQCATGPLREDLVDMLVSHEHDLEYRADELLRDLGMEEVGHRVHEDHPRI
jgi:hypothetical protein